MSENQSATRRAPRETARIERGYITYGAQPEEFWQENSEGRDTEPTTENAAEEDEAESATEGEGEEYQQTRPKQGPSYVSVAPQPEEEGEPYQQ